MISSQISHRNTFLSTLFSMPHDGWRDMAAVYIDAYKAGSSSPDVTVSSSVYTTESHLLILSSADGRARLLLPSESERRRLYRPNWQTHRIPIRRRLCLCDGHAHLRRDCNYNVSLGLNAPRSTVPSSLLTSFIYAQLRI